MKTSVKTRAEIRRAINRQNYLRHQADRQAKARERNRSIRASWRSAIADWDQANREPSPAVVEAACLSEWAVLKAYGDPLEELVEMEEAGLV